MKAGNRSDSTQIVPFRSIWKFEMAILRYIFVAAIVGAFLYNTGQLLEREIYNAMTEYKTKNKFFGLLVCISTSESGRTV